MKVSSGKTRKKDTGCSLGVQAGSTRGISRMIFAMDTGRCSGPMEMFTEGGGRMGSKTARVSHSLFRIANYAQQRPIHRNLPQ